MTDHDAGDIDPAMHSRMNSGQSSSVEPTSEALGAYRRPEYPSLATSESHPMHAGHCAPYYGQGPIAYSDYPDRYSMGYQRLGQTITLTSHKIQFGCQGNSHAAFPNQRCTGPALRHQYHMIPPVGKPWVESCSDRAQSNAKSNNRGRTTYSDDQIAELESVFNSNPYPTSQTRQRLAYKIDVPEGKVKIWFQNRRARAKKSKMSCGVSWRTAMGDSNALDDRGNQNNNNAQDMSSKSNPCESSIPIASILPLPTKTSIANSSLVPCVPAWRGYYDTSTRNPNCSRRYHPNTDCSMHGGCSCGDVSAPYSIRMDRFMHASHRSMPNSMCLESRPYSANALHSPPPIRRLIYPFHALTQKSTKSEQEHEFTREAPCTSQEMYSVMENNGVDSTSLLSRGLSQNSALATVSSSNTYSELRQCTPSDWDSGQGTTSNETNYPKGIASDLETGVSNDLVRSCAVASRSSGRGENGTAASDEYRNAGLMSCMKTDNTVAHSAKASLPVSENGMGNQVWNNRASSLLKSMENFPTTNERHSVQTDANAVGANELSEMWPANFSGSMCTPAPPSIVG